MTRLDFERLLDELDVIIRDLRGWARLLEVIDGADVTIEGHATDRIVSKFHLRGRTLYLLVAPEFLEEDYRAWIVEEDQPLSDSTIRQMWDSYSDEYLTETIEERQSDGPNR